jgi:hypothetical protein
VVVDRRWAAVDPVAGEGPGSFLHLEAYVALSHPMLSQFRRMDNERV